MIEYFFISATTLFIIFFGMLNHKRVTRLLLLASDKNARLYKRAQMVAQSLLSAGYIEILRQWIYTSPCYCFSLPIWIKYAGLFFLKFAVIWVVVSFIEISKRKYNSNSYTHQHKTEMIIYTGPILLLTAMLLITGGWIVFACWLAGLTALFLYHRALTYP